MSFSASRCSESGDSLDQRLLYVPVWQVAVLNSGVLQKALSEQLKENTQLSAKDMAEKMATTSPAAELESQANELQFQVAVTAAAGRSARGTRCTLMLVSSSGTD